jgi:hypothetical protein
MNELWVMVESSIRALLCCEPVAIAPGDRVDVALRAALDHAGAFSDEYGDPSADDVEKLVSRATRS